MNRPGFQVSRLTIAQHIFESLGGLLSNRGAKKNSHRHSIAIIIQRPGFRVSRLFIAQNIIWKLGGGMTGEEECSSIITTERVPNTPTSYPHKLYQVPGASPLVVYKCRRRRTVLTGWAQPAKHKPLFPAVSNFYILIRQGWPSSILPFPAVRASMLSTTTRLPGVLLLRAISSCVGLSVFFIRLDWLLYIRSREQGGGR